MKNSMYVCMSLLWAASGLYAAEKRCDNKIIVGDSGSNRNYISNPKAVRPKNADKNLSLEKLFPFEIEYKGVVEYGAIFVDVDNDNCRIVDEYELDKKGSTILRLSHEDIDTDKEIIITIRDNRFPTYANYNEVYTINAKGKTVYLKWEDDKLQPRVGSTFGSKTPSGLSVKNNVQASDIRKEKVVRLKPNKKKLPAVVPEPLD